MNNIIETNLDFYPAVPDGYLWFQKSQDWQFYIIKKRLQKV